MKDKREKLLLNLLKTKECCLTQLNPIFWESKQEWEKECTYDFYLYLIEEELEYPLDKKYILTEEEFNFYKEWLRDE